MIGRLRRVALVCVVATAGCSLVNTIDRSKLDWDAGSDASSDTGVPDADSSTDVGPPDTGCEADSGCGEVEDCSDGLDNDGDGLADCLDFACAGAPECCEAGDTIFAEDWNPAIDFRLNWNPVPSTENTFPTRASGGISSFGVGTFPVAALHKTCTPMNYGVEVELVFETRGEETCTTSPCHEFAALVFTAATDAVIGNRLLDELAITIDALGQLIVTQNATPVAAAPVELGEDQEVRVVVLVGPGSTAERDAAVVATVTAENLTAGTEPVLVLESFPFLEQSQLVSGVADCQEVPGLYIGVEGRGNGVRVRPLTVAGRECVNPSQFLEPEDGAVTLTHDALALGDWAVGGLTTPALASSCLTADCHMAGGIVRWDLMVAASNVDLNLESLTHVGFSIGHSFTTTWSTPPWLSNDFEIPRAGADPPSCLDVGGGCDPDSLSLREPSLLANLDEQGRLAEVDPFLVAYAREIESEVLAGRRDRFEILLESITANPNDAFAVSGASRRIQPPTGCISIRHPSLVAAGDTSVDGYFLFYTCERSGMPSDIRAAKLSRFFTVTSTTVVLDPDMLGSYAEGGVSGSEAIVVFDAEGRATIRLWFLARGPLGIVLGLAQGQASSAATLPEVFDEYSGNPVLTSTSSILGGCSGECGLLGVAVVSRGDNVGGTGAIQTLRFLLARRVNEASEVAYELIPLEQLWRNP